MDYGCFTPSAESTFSFEYLLEWFTGDLLFYYTLLRETIQDIFFYFTAILFLQKESKPILLSLYEMFITQVRFRTAKKCLESLQLSHQWKIVFRIVNELCLLKCKPEVCYKSIKYWQLIIKLILNRHKIINIANKTKTNKRSLMNEFKSTVVFCFVYYRAFIQCTKFPSKVNRMQNCSSWKTIIYVNTRS